MSIKIIDVSIKTNNNWQSVSEMPDWNAVKNSNADWNQPLQTASVGQPIKIKVELAENNWDEVRSGFANWQEIKGKFINWLSFKNR